jgi:hypothetical protein
MTDLVPMMETADIYTTADGQRRIVTTPRRMAILSVIMSKSTGDKDRFYRALGLAQRIFYASNMAWTPSDPTHDDSALTIDPETGLAEVDIDDEYIEAISGWTGGQDCMLYAVVSTGGLTLGSRRPYDRDADRSLTDQEWHVSLWSSLESDVRYAADTAAKSKSRRIRRDADILREFEAFCDATTTALRTLYGLDDSDVV